MPNIYENTRIFFSKSPTKPEYPDLLEVQLNSFKQFFQIDTPPEKRPEEGLYKVFLENFPVTDARENFVLEFKDYIIDPPRYDIEECKERGLTYAVNLKVKFYLYCNDPDNDDFEPVTQEVFLGSIPYMTPSGTFVVNGAERVIVSQLHRSPGVFFGQSIHPNGTKLYSARIIPFKGAWIEFSTDVNNVMYAYIDGKKKFPITTLLRAIGYSTDHDILQIFDLAEEVKVTRENLLKCKGRRLAARVLKTWYEDFVDEDTGEVINITRSEVIFERDHVISEEDIDVIIETGEKSIILLTETSKASEYSIILNTLQKDNSNSELEAVQLIYRQLRNADPPDDETARGIIDKLFFSDKRYDLGHVGRYRLNKKLHGSQEENSLVLTKKDIVLIVKYLIELLNSKANVDDIDHLSNRRVRTVGEQLYAQFSVGLARMARTIRERMNIRDNEIFTPADLINSRILSSVISSFFGTSQLSQFMDQTNPLAEITHKRRISALGPGGLSREHAGFEVRDVHYSHYGRLCPIETPEGPNIGLISSLCIYAKVNSMGFIETPYWKVKDGEIEGSYVYLSAEEEDNAIIAPSNELVPGKEKVKARHMGDFPVVDRKEVDYVDFATNQIVSLAASLIPFLEHNDANRALMGSNMQRQAVPLISPEAPYVGTGIELKAGADSRALLIAEGDGEVISVDANHIKIKYERDPLLDLVSFDGNIVTYTLPKFKRTNQSTCINLKPIVKQGDRVKKGTVLTEGYCTKDGELALGRNLLVAFMPWQGYNFEDAIVISEKVVAEDIFTSIHIEEFELQVRDTKLGQEELTNEIPNVSEEATRNLDENGLIRIGAEVKEQDILIGKITPKGETDPTPEERLLRAIFGDKAGDVKDASLKAPPSFYGIVIGKKLFSKDKKDIKSRQNDKKKISEIEERFNEEKQKLNQLMFQKLSIILEGKKLKSIKNRTGEEVIPEGKKFTEKYASLDFLELVTTDWTDDEKTNQLIHQLFLNYKQKYNILDGQYKRQKHQISIGDELPTGIIKLAKVYVANKRKLKVGDKMAGRHGNKGIVSRIVRVEDMPFLEDGTPVDIVLNPLGVPSRMNLGQIYETILGWAGKKLGVKFATPVFDGADIDEVNQWLEKAGLPPYGRTYLYDGQTGERFDQPTTVGVIYMLKLSHMVDDKMHARSIGPYSLITQQPLGGKAQFGGQRFGEMEVWALEAFGAAHILRELLTVKSDDVIGRAKTYEAIVKGENIPEPGVPESFNVLLHELRGLALEVTLE
ncbi:MAG: DNA-directed RNA polymerase subunit beta [Bacteroidia bacterium]|nr:DNA-directed RNA polymerase subunit beta [Bacteroidia bacterium]MDW8158650.1 DNA-directed RNA polymerase subunit beta [Bacteroidia bacterium]